MTATVAKKTATATTELPPGEAHPCASFVFPVEPVPASRPRVTKWGTYIAKPYKTWLADAAAYLKTVSGCEIPKEHLRVSVEVVCTRARTSKLSTPKGDIDNYVKAPLDAISHAKLWDDDKWVTSLTAHKRFAHPGESAHTRVLVFLDA